MSSTSSSLGWGVDHASPLPAMSNDAMRVLNPPMLSSYVIENLRYTNPIHMILPIETSVNLCDSIVYLCEDTTNKPRFADGAIDGTVKNVTMSPPNTKEFHGWHKGAFQVKIAKDQLDCINRNAVLGNWYRNSINRAIEDGKEAIKARFYRHLMVHGVHPKNTGNNAGLSENGHYLGTPENPVVLRPDDTMDRWYGDVIDVSGQMPMASMGMDNFYGMSQDNLFIFGPTKLDTLARKHKDWNSYDKMGDCGACSMMNTGFNRNPYGIYHITGRCIESRTFKSGQDSCTAHPVLFGRRNQGTKASLSVDVRTWDSQDGESHFLRVNYYYHIHTYDCRNMGLSWVNIQDTRPELAECGVA